MVLKFPCLLVGLALAGCSEPSYRAPASDAGELLPNSERDAGTPPDASTRADAFTPPADAMPVPAADAMPLPAADASTCTDCASFATGQYAVLARFYGSSAATGGGWFAEDSIALVDVQQVPGSDRLRMSWQTCAYRGQLVVPLLPAINYAVVSPQTFATRTFELKVSGDSFQASGDPGLNGYEDVTACPPGGSQSHPDRPWLLSGQCSCPSSDLPPTLVSDCRVIDSDGDAQPGFTVQFTGGTENSSYTRIRDSSQMVNGKLSPDGRHSANWLANADTYQLSCAREPCSRASAQLCPAAQNPVRFLPLDAKNLDWDCAGAVTAAENSGLIGLGLPTAPDC